MSYRFIIAGPYIAIGVQDLEPLSEEKRQDAASTLICVNRRCPGGENSFMKKARGRPPSGFCWLSKSGDLEIDYQCALDGLDRVTTLH